MAAEIHDLSKRESDSLTLAQDQLSHLLREKEIKYFQMAMLKDVLLGDNSTCLTRRRARLKDNRTLKTILLNFIELFGPPE